MRIPITMCHGIQQSPKHVPPLTVEYFDRLMGIAAQLGCTSIHYDDLAAWRAGAATLPERPIMIDFDHPWISMRRGVHDVLDRYGFTGNLFIHTGPLDAMYSLPLPPDDEREWMTWEEIGELVDGGPPEAARYITKGTHPYRLPAMDLQHMLYTPEAFRSYLERAAA